MPLTSFGLVGLALLAAPPAPAEADRPVQTLDLVAQPDLTVALHVRRRASLADREWLALEFTNRGDRPLEIEVAHYSIDGRAKGRGPEPWLLQTVLTSGNSRDLFPRPQMSGLETTFTLPPCSSYRLAGPPSDLAAGELGLPLPAGVDVAGTARIFLRVKDRGNLETPAGGLPFALVWTYPDAAGLAAINDRLKRLLREPLVEHHHHALLSALLRAKVLARAVSRDELLAALDRRGDRLTGRTANAEALIKFHDGEKAVLAYYGDRLRAKEVTALDDVFQLRLWSPAFAGPVVRFYGDHQDTDRLVLNLLHLHWKDWLRHADEVQRLTAQVQKKHPVLGRKVGELEGKELEDWAAAVGELALVADRAAIVRLRPALADRRVWWRPNPGAAFMRTPPPLVRVCDTADLAITAILDGPPARWGPGLGMPGDLLPSPPGRQTEAAYLADRDARIERTKARLAALDKQ